MLGWRVDRLQTRDVAIDTFRDSFRVQPKSVIKESLQNSQDVPVKISSEDILKKTFFDYKDEETVDVTYQILEITEKAKKEYLDSIDSGSLVIYLRYLIDSLKNSDKSEQYKAEIKRLQESIKLMSDDNKDSIFILNVIDKNTKGLIGETRAVNAPLNFRNFNFSIAESEKAQGGGSWAVGKIAFTTCSNISTLFNCSNLSEPLKRDGQDKNLRRLYGISLQVPSHVGKKHIDETGELITTDHQDVHTHFSNTWLFGDVSTELTKDELPPKSSRVDDFFDEDRSVTSKMLIDVLEDSETGTVVQVPFFNMQYKETARKDVKKAKTLKEMADKFIDICIDLAWESILSKKSNIEIQFGKISEGNIRDARLEKVNISEILSDSHDKAILSSIELSRGIKEAITNDSLDNGIEVVEDGKTSYFLSDIDISINKKDKDGISFNYNPHLALYIFDKEEDHEIPDKFANKIAIMRSPGLIIEYKPLEHGNSQKIIYGVLYLGTALMSNQENIWAEEYYRYCEDKAHNSIFTKSEENLLNKAYYPSIDMFSNTREDLIVQTWEPILERINSLFVIGDDTKGKRYFDLEKRLKLTASPEKEDSFILDAYAKPNSKTKTLQPIEVPKKTKLKITNKPANPLSLSGEKLGGGLIKIKKIEQYEDSDCKVEVIGNDLLITNDSDLTQNVIYEITYESKTDSKNKYVALNPNIKAERSN